MSFAARPCAHPADPARTCSILSGWMSFAACPFICICPFSSRTCSILSGWMSFAAANGGALQQNFAALQYPQRMDELFSNANLKSLSDRQAILQYPQRMDELCSVNHLQSDRQSGQSCSILSGWMSFAAWTCRMHGDDSGACSILSGWMSFAASAAHARMSVLRTCSILSGWMSFAAAVLLRKHD